MTNVSEHLLQVVASANDCIAEASQGLAALAADPPHDDYTQHALSAQGALWDAQEGLNKVRSRPCTVDRTVSKVPQSVSKDSEIKQASAVLRSFDAIARRLSKEAELWLQYRTPSAARLQLGNIETKLDATRATFDSAIANLSNALTKKVVPDPPFNTPPPEPDKNPEREWAKLTLDTKGNAYLSSDAITLRAVLAQAVARSSNPRLRDLLQSTLGKDILDPVNSKKLERTASKCSEKGANLDPAGVDQRTINWTRNALEEAFANPVPPNRDAVISAIAGALPQKL